MSREGIALYRWLEKDYSWSLTKSQMNKVKAHLARQFLLLQKREPRPKSEEQAHFGQEAHLVFILTQVVTVSHPIGGSLNLTAWHN